MNNILKTMKNQWTITKNFFKSWNPGKHNEKNLQNNQKTLKNNEHIFKILKDHRMPSRIF